MAYSAGCADKSVAGREHSRVGKRNVVCGVCMQTYCQPKCLPCRHTFCLKCVRQLASPRQAIPRQHEEREPGKSTGVFTPAEFFPFTCPTCRQNITVPPGGVDEFQADFSMEAEVAAQSLTTVLCDMCQKQAEAGCQECQKRLCPKCRHIHDQFAGASFHSLTALNPHILPEKTPASSKRSRGQRRTVCKIHAQDSTLYCRQCDAALCSQCLATSHRNHATENLTTRMEQMRVEVRGLLQKAQKEAESVEKVIQQKVEEGQELIRQEEEMVRQTVDAAGKVRAWAEEAENNAVSQITAISTPIKTRVKQEKDAAHERKTVLSQLRERARLMSPSGSFHELKSLKEDMEASLSLQPTSTAEQPKVGGEATNIVFRRWSSGKDTLQTTVPKFVGEVTSFDADTHLQNNSAWGFDPSVYDVNATLSFYTTVNGLIALYPTRYMTGAAVTEFHPGNKARVKNIQLPIRGCPCSSTSLPSSDILLLWGSSHQCCVGPDLDNLNIRQCSGFSPLHFLSHDSLPNGRNAHVCGKKFHGVCEIQELIYNNPPGNLVSRPVFQIVCKTDSIVAFDVSSDAKYFAVLNVIRFSENESHYTQSQVSVFERMKAEPCAVFRSPKTVVDSVPIVDGDVCFASYKGKEMLRVAVPNDDAVYSLDFRHDCALVGRTPLNKPRQVRTDPAGRTWVVCSNHVVAFNSG